MLKDRRDSTVVKAILGDHPHELNRRDKKAIEAYRRKYRLADDEVIVDGKIIKVPVKSTQSILRTIIDDG